MAGVSVHVNTDGLAQLAERLKVVATELDARVRAQLLANAKIVAVAAAARAAQHSKSIPPTVKALEVGDGAIVQAGNGSSPLPSLMERGSIHKPNPTSWRHPLFGDREHWYAQKTHPYLRPAVEATRIENQARMARAVAELVRETIGGELPT